MGTLTPNLGLYKAAGTENVDVVAAINNAFDKIDTAVGPNALTAYVPSALGINALGNGSLTGKYRVSGKLCFIIASLSVGSTTTFNGATIGLGLPFPSVAAGPFAVLVGNLYKASTNFTYFVNGAPSSGSSIVGLYTHAGGPVTGTAPVALATSDGISIAGFYEIT